MRKSYEGASNDIKTWLANNKGDIDKAWDEDASWSGYVWWIGLVVAGLLAGGACFAAILAFAGPKARPLLFAGLGTIVAVLGFSSWADDDYSKKHKGWTLLQLAAEAGAVDVARCLLQNGANPKGKNGEDFFEIAIRNKQARFVFEMQKDEVARKVESISKCHIPKGCTHEKELENLKEQLKAANVKIQTANTIIQNFELYKEKAEIDLLKLAEMIKKYEELVSGVSASKDPSLFQKNPGQKPADAPQQPSFAKGR